MLLEHLGVLEQLDIVLCEYLRFELYRHTETKAGIAATSSQVVLASETQIPLSPPGVPSVPSRVIASGCVSGKSPLPIPGIFTNSPTLPDIILNVAGHCAGLDIYCSLYRRMPLPILHVIYGDRPCAQRCEIYTRSHPETGNTRSDMISADKPQASSAGTLPALTHQCLTNTIPVNISQTSLDSSMPLSLRSLGLRAMRAPPPQRGRDNTHRGMQKNVCRDSRHHLDANMNYD